jgi:hypothetical protein
MVVKPGGGMPVNITPCSLASGCGNGGKMSGEEIRKKAVRMAILLIVAVAVICTGYVMVVLNWSYSKGERVGYVQKFSEKGWLCKTWEGELQMLPVPGAIPEKFLFSVHDKTLVAKINSSMGKKVSLFYEQHKGIPTTCFGESEYFAVDAKVLE